MFGSFVHTVCHRKHKTLSITYYENLCHCGSFALYQNALITYCVRLRVLCLNCMMSRSLVALFAYSLITLCQCVLSALCECVLIAYIALCFNWTMSLCFDCIMPMGFLVDYVVVLLLHYVYVRGLHYGIVLWSYYMNVLWLHCDIVHTLIALCVNVLWIMLLCLDCSNMFWQCVLIAPCQYLQWMWNLLSWVTSLWCVGITESPVDWREIFMKQSVGKCKQINF